MNPTRKLLLLECNIDDMNPELFPYVLEELFEAGARDAWLTPIVMKSGRPAQTLSALIDADKRAETTAVIFAQTSSIGVRIQEIEREELEREIVTVNTKYGTIPIKLARDATGRILNAAPEIKSCHAASKTQGVPIKLIYQEAMREFKVE